PATIHAGGSSTLTLNASSSATVGDVATFNVLGTAASDTESASAELTVAGNFALTINPASATVGPGNSKAFTVQTAASSSPVTGIALTVSGSLPSGVTAGFSPSTINAGTPSTLTLTVAPTAPAVSNAAFTVKGVDDDGIVRTVIGHITIAGGNDFSISINPASPSLAAGTSTVVAV